MLNTYEEFAVISNVRAPPSVQGSGFIAVDGVSAFFDPYSYVPDVPVYRRQRRRADRRKPRNPSAINWNTVFHWTTPHLRSQVKWSTWPAIVDGHDRRQRTIGSAWHSIGQRF
jgi:hypothetical protein